MDEGEFACPLGPTVRLTARPPERLFRFVLESHHGRAPGADSEEKHEPASDIDTVAVDSLKALDPEWPIREADTAGRFVSLKGERSPSLWRQHQALSTTVIALAQVQPCRSREMRTTPTPPARSNWPSTLKTGYAGCCRYFPRGGGDSASASGSGLPFVSGKKGTAISPRI